jgi:Zn-dependent M28 family amino/carboxypeptidase
MTRTRSLLQAAALMVVGVAAPSLLAAQAPVPSAAATWWNTIKTLADDSMRGRETGSPEHRKAAEYIAAAFKQAGLEPAGIKGWYQPVRFAVRRVVEDQSSIALTRDGAATPLTFGEDVTLSARAPLASRVEAPLVFIGFGLHVPEIKYDDLEGLDLRGKVVVTLGGGVPKGVSGPILAHSRTVAWQAIREAGAVGIISIANPKGDVPWSRASLARFAPQMTLADDDGAGPGPQLSATFNPAQAEKLFAGSGHSYAEVQAIADSGGVLPRFALPVGVRAAMTTRSQEVFSDNVVGVIRGNDPVARREYVVVSAHLDHIGIGRPIDGDSIYNGAMDNASGIATLLETARTLNERRKTLRRSVIFVAVTGEEKGLLGSSWFGSHPTVPADEIVADLNTDMFLPINPLRMLLVNGLEESDLADDARVAARHVNVMVVTDPEPERNAFVRSDQYSFIKQGIPSISLKVGFVKGSPEHQKVLAWRQERYHGPKDDLTQPIDFQAAADFNALYAGLVSQVANRATRPSWNSDSFFRRFAATTP